ncbi:hypothetical protein BC828DRAFT_17768 [Blastocladiella britannica]|nr:hypothetical protein BC828DRAFT_17768 [Blastocladiella britannica]
MTTSGASAWRTIAVEHVLANIRLSNMFKQLRFGRHIFKINDPIHPEIAQLATLGDAVPLEFEGRRIRDTLARLALGPQPIDLAVRTGASQVLERINWLWVLARVQNAHNEGTSAEMLWALLSVIQRLPQLADPRQYVATLLGRIEVLAREFDRLPGVSALPRFARVQRLGQFLFGGEQDTRQSTLFPEHPDGSLLHRVLDPPHLGLPISRCVLLAAVAARLADPLPITLCNWPSVFLARIDNYLLDPFNYDRQHPGAWMVPLSEHVNHIQDVGFPYTPAMTDPSPPLIVFGRMLNNLVAAYLDHLRNSREFAPGAVAHMYRYLGLQRYLSRLGGGVSGGGGGRNNEQASAVLRVLPKRLGIVLDAPDRVRDPITSARYSKLPSTIAAEPLKLPNCSRGRFVYGLNNALRIQVTKELGIDPVSGDLALDWLPSSPVVCNDPNVVRNWIAARPWIPTSLSGVVLLWDRDRFVGPETVEWDCLMPVLGTFFSYFDSPTSVFQRGE